MSLPASDIQLFFQYVSNTKLRFFYETSFALFFSFFLSFTMKIWHKTAVSRFLLFPRTQTLIFPAMHRIRDNLKIYLLKHSKTGFQKQI